MAQFSPNFYLLKLDPRVQSLRITDTQGRPVTIIHNREGEKASLSIYMAIAVRFSNRLHAKSAQFGISLYGEYVEEEIQTRGKHPNIRRLLEIVEYRIEYILEPVFQE